MSASSSAVLPASLSVRHGSIYLSVDVVETYFKNIDSVIVLIRDGALQILPVHQIAAGGCLLKIRNAAGDRVVAAHDVFAANELLDWCAEDIPAQWSPDQRALIAQFP